MSEVYNMKTVRVVRLIKWIVINRLQTNTKLLKHLFMSGNE